MHGRGQHPMGSAGRGWREAIVGAAGGLALLGTVLVLPQPPAPPASGLGLRSVGAPHRSSVVGDPAALFGSGIAVDFVNGQDGWAVVAALAGAGLCGRVPGGTAQSPPPCQVLTTTDGGAHWAVGGLRTAEQLTGLEFVDALHGLAWGPDALFSTADGGTHWVTEDAGADVPSSLDLVTPAALWGVSGGAVESSADFGAAWRTALRTPACAFSSVRFSGPQDGWAAGTSAAGVCLFATADGGGTWSPIFETLSGGPAAAAFRQYVAQDFGGVSPAAWEAGSTAAAPWGICATVQAAPVSALAGWLVVDWCGGNTGGETVLRTADGGRTWAEAWGTAGCLMGCRGDGEGAAPAFFLNATTAWMWAPFGVARTLDGGTSWSRTPMCGGGRALPGRGGAGALCVRPQCGGAVRFVSDDVGWAASPQGLFATTDGGETWVRQWPAPSLPGPLAAVSFGSASTGFAIPVDRPEALVETRDGGRTWTPLRAPLPGQALAGLSFRSATAGCVWSASQLACTDDGGSTWRPVRTPDTQPAIVGAGFADAEHGWAASFGGALWFTADGGAEWRRAGPFPGARRGSAAAFVLTGAESGWALVAEAPARPTSAAPAPPMGAWALDRTLDGGGSWRVVAT